MTDNELQRYTRPRLAQILRAVPNLQWRRCDTCEYVAIYRDAMACLCHVCGSPNTRLMRSATKAMHDEAELDDAIGILAQR